MMTSNHEITDKIITNVIEWSVSKDYSCESNTEKVLQNCVATLWSNHRNFLNHVVSECNVNHHSFWSDLTKHVFDEDGNGITWGRITALLTLASVVAKRFPQRKEEITRAVIDSFILSNVHQWINDRPAGWQEYAQLFDKENATLLSQRRFLCILISTFTVGCICGAYFGCR
jgi:hypothetical protein